LAYSGLLANTNVTILTDLTVATGWRLRIGVDARKW